MVQPVNASMIIMMLYTTFLLIKTLSNPYLCHISHAANAWSSSISRPFLTTAPCASPFFMNSVTFGLYNKSLEQMVWSQ